MFEVPLKMPEINDKLQKGFLFGGWLPKIIPDCQSQFQLPYENKASYSSDYYQFQAFLAGMDKNSVASPNPSVGCVIVKDNKILAKGCTHEWKGIHAERDAFNQVEGKNLEGAHVYLTLEPCTHFGNQPPCVELFRGKGIQKVFISRLDANPHVKENGIRILKNMGIQVNLGFFSNEITAWNYPFFIQQILQRPMISLKWNQSLNGNLLNKNIGMQLNRNPISHKYTQFLKLKYDSILIDLSTLLEDEKSFNTKDKLEHSHRHPMNIIFDPKANILLCPKNKQLMLKKKYLTKNRKNVFLVEQNMIREVLSSSSEWSIELKTSKNIKFLPIHNDELNMFYAKDVLECFQNQEFINFFGRPLQSIFVEDSPHLLSLFIQDELFDVAHVFIASFILSESHHKQGARINSVLAKITEQKATANKRWKLIAQECLGNDTLMEIIPAQRFKEVFC